jgi:threonine synthase
MIVFCEECNKTVELSPDIWRCDCGGAFEPIEQNSFDLERIDRTDYSIWRYRKLYGLDFEQPTARLGAGWTPLVELAQNGHRFAVKLEFIAPTGSFKDRGMALMINTLAHQGVTSVIDDSSGNAGASVAAYAARAGMRADIFVPAHASASKQAQIAVYGAHVLPVPGPRENAKLAAQEAAALNGVYASHAYHPAYLLGQQSAAWELWEQLGQQTPDWIVMPCAQGGNLLGYWLGFRRLQAARLIKTMPRLVGVQSVLIDPLVQAFHQGVEDVPAVEPKGTSLAEGIAISKPVRGKMLLRALRENGGLALAVEDTEIVQAQNWLAHQGIWVEPTSATAVAALQRVFEMARPEETIVVSLTGSGLKGKPEL